MQISRLETRGYPKLLKITKIIGILFIIIISINSITLLTKEEIIELDEYEQTINELTSAIENYITKENLPAETLNISIKQLIESNNLTAKGCYQEEDNLTLTKEDNNYLLKIKISCKENKNDEYTILQLGEYDYCENTICVKQAIKIT